MNGKDSNIEDNLRRLAQIKSKNPNTTHVYFKRLGLDNATIDIPIGQAEFQIRHKPEWELLTSNEEMDAEVAALFETPVSEEENIAVGKENPWDKTKGIKRAPKPADDVPEDLPPPGGSGESGTPDTEPEIPPRPSEVKKTRKPRAKKRK